MASQATEAAGAACIENDLAGVDDTVRVFYASLEDGEQKAIALYLSSFLHWDPPERPKPDRIFGDLTVEQLNSLRAYASARVAGKEVPSIGYWPNAAELLIAAGVLPKEIKPKEDGGGSLKSPDELSKFHWKKIRWRILEEELGPFDPTDLRPVEQLMVSLGVEREPGGYWSDSVGKAIPLKVGPPTTPSEQKNPYFRGFLNEPARRDIGFCADYILKHDPDSFKKVMLHYDRASESHSEEYSSQSLTDRAYFSSKVADSRAAARKMRGQDIELDLFVTRLFGDIYLNRRDRLTNSDRFRSLSTPILKEALDRLKAMAAKEVGRGASQKQFESALKRRPEAPFLFSWKAILSPGRSWRYIQTGAPRDRPENP